MEELKIKNKEKKTREMAANVKLFADRTMSASQKKKQQKKRKNKQKESGIMELSSGS